MTKDQDQDQEKDQQEGTNPEAEQAEPDNISYLNGDSEAFDLEELLEREQARVEELTDQLQRERAELINYRRRKEQEQEAIKNRAVESTLQRLLPVADDFHRAIQALPEETEGNTWVDGFKLIEANFRKALESLGVTPMEAVGTPFDPNLHEAVMFDEGTVGEHMVVAEFQRGYMIHDRVLRPAMVRVGSLESADADDQNE